MSGKGQEGQRGGSPLTSTLSQTVKATYIQFTEESASDIDNPTYYVSPELVQVIGYPADMMMDDKDSTWWDSILHPEDRDRYWNSASESYDAGRPYHIEYRIKNAAGEWILIREEARLLTEGNRTFWMGTIQNISEPRQPK